MIEKQRQKSGSLTQEDKDKITGQLLRWRATILAAFHCSKCGKTREYREAKQDSLLSIVNALANTATMRRPI